MADIERRKVMILNSPSAEIDVEWVNVAKKRLAELRSGSTKPVSGGEVFTKIQERYDNGE